MLEWRGALSYPGKEWDDTDIVCVLAGVAAEEEEEAEEEVSEFNLDSFSAYDT